ncbi:MAG: hypothetical protein ACNYNX_02430 [Leucobacter sp.]|nr:hypothetical protein [Candidatus Leucobacter sulfamidivorax]
MNDENQGTNEGSGSNPPQPPAPNGQPQPPQPPPYTAPPAPQIPQYQAPQPPYTAPPGYQGPGAPGQQGAPQQPWAQPQPQQPVRRGLPVGAWIGIGAGALVLVGAMVLVILLVVIPATRLVTELGRDRATASEPAEDGLVEEEPLSPASVGVLTLDDTADFLAGPYWSVPFFDDWDIVTFDVEGINHFSNAGVGCQLLTYQGYGDPNVADGNDWDASEATVPAALQIGLPWDSTGDPDVVMDGIFEVSADYYDSVEMVRLFAQYSSAEGERERQMLIRAFMPENIVLYAEVDCLAGSQVPDEIFDRLRITEF